MAYSQGAFTLLADASATGQNVQWPGGRGTFSVPTGTFGGATVSLQWSPDGANFLAADQGGTTYVTLTAAGAGGFELPPGAIRADVSGGTPSGLYAYAQCNQG